MSCCETSGQVNTVEGAEEGKKALAELSAYMQKTLNPNTCPNCGYCPHCGRRNAQPYRPWQQWPYPYEPYEITRATSPSFGDPQVRGTRTNVHQMVDHSFSTADYSKYRYVGRTSESIQGVEGSGV